MTAGPARADATAHGSPWVAHTRDHDPRRGWAVAANDHPDGAIDPRPGIDYPVTARHHPLLGVHTNLGWTVMAAMIVIAALTMIRTMTVYAPTVVRAIHLALVTLFMTAGLALGGIGVAGTLRGRRS